MRKATECTARASDGQGALGKVNTDLKLICSTVMVMGGCSTAAAGSRFTQTPQSSQPGEGKGGRTVTVTGGTGSHQLAIFLTSDFRFFQDVSLLVSLQVLGPQRREHEVDLSGPHLGCHRGKNPVAESPNLFWGNGTNRDPDMFACGHRGWSPATLAPREGPHDAEGSRSTDPSPL